MPTTALSNVDFEHELNELVWLREKVADSVRLTHAPTHANRLPTRLPTRTWTGSDGF
jgi:hypothetical protein